jgi:serine/threonine-protein kinase RsbW
VSGAIPNPFAASWPAVPASVPAARHAVVHHLREVATSDPPLSDIGLVVSEAVTNVVNHAYADGSPGTVHVRIEFTDEELELVVEDEGRGLVPRLDSPGAGLGLPLIATISDRFDTRTTPGCGTRLCIWFRRDPEARTLPG